MESKIELNRDEGGNAELPRPKQLPQSYYWILRLSNYTNQDIEHLEHIFKCECDWYLFQEEIGEQGTPHLQGTLKLKKRKRMTEMKKLHLSVHWEITKSVSKSIEYSSKQATRNGKQFTYNIDIPDDIDVEEPYGWQLEIMNIIKEKPDKRSIYWFYNRLGNIGKSTLAKYLVVKHEALILSGKSNDMFHMLSEAKKKRKIIIIDVPRSSKDYINYGAIEQIKNGLIFSGKYKGSQLVFNCPHVIVLANEPPDTTQMSLDRWRIFDIDLNQWQNINSVFTY